MFTLDEVVPWGRSFEEYRKMFGLSEGDLGKRIIGCGDGPASFNAEATGRGHSVVSADPIYDFETGQLRERVIEAYDTILEQTNRNSDEFVWSHIRSIEELGEVRMGAMVRFLADFDKGRVEGRYVAASLPKLPFEAQEFQLALCSHFLFLYSAQFDEDFHLRSLLELARIADEVRVFPLLALGGIPSAHLQPVLDKLPAHGLIASIEEVDYEFLRGANQMLRIVRRLQYKV